MKKQVMSALMLIEHGVLKLTLDRPVHDIDLAKDLRGAVASLFPDDILFHHHQKGDRFLYRYPLIQYKIMNGQAVILGIGPGAYALTKADLLNKEINLGKEPYRVLLQEIICTQKQMGLSQDSLRYRFLSPWLALNENNYQKYIRMGISEKRIEFLSKVLTANIISMSKGLSYTIKETIQVNEVYLNETLTRLKGTPMLGFFGAFSVNFEIPQFCGLGKSVARGFGTMERTPSP